MATSEGIPSSIDIEFLELNDNPYNKFLSIDGEVKVAINYDRIADDSKWDGLKGYLTNTDIPIQDVYTAYHNLWHVERAFRIAKSKIEIRPMFHFTRKRIEAHICICFVALKVYKELERMLKVSEIKMSVDKVLALAKTITTIQIKLPLNKEVYTQTMLMARHQKIAKLFDEDFWVTRWRSQEKALDIKQTLNTTDADGYQYSFVSAVGDKSTEKLTVTLNLFNPGESREKQMAQAQFTDYAGNAYESSEYQFGNMENVKPTIESNTNIKIKFFFADVSTDTKRIASLTKKANSSTWGNSDMSFNFRDFPIEWK